MNPDAYISSNSVVSRRVAGMAKTRCSVLWISETFADRARGFGQVNQWLRDQERRKASKM